MLPLPCQVAREGDAVEAEAPIEVRADDPGIGGKICQQEMEWDPQVMALQQDGEEANVPLNLQQRMEAPAAFTVAEEPEAMVEDLALMMVSVVDLDAAEPGEEGLVDSALTRKELILVQRGGR